MAYPIRPGYFSEMLFPTWGPMQRSEQKIAQFRPHDWTKELAYVSTQIQAKFDTCI